MSYYQYEGAIIRETHDGLSRITLCDNHLMQREIYCIGEINRDMAISLISQLRYLATEDADHPIVMYIDSPGGSVDAGLALVDAMRSVKCPVYTVNVATAASMAALVFMSGEHGHRLSFAHATVMCHDPLIPGGVGGSALSIYDTSQRLMKKRETLAGIISECTGKSLEEVYSITAKDTFFDATEAIEWGICDGIITDL